MKPLFAIKNFAFSLLLLPFLYLYSEELDSNEEMISEEQLLKEKKQLIAQTEEQEFEESFVEPDMDALRKWIRDKRLITVKETGGDFSLSGDIRTDFSDADEKKDGVQQRGHSDLDSKPARSYNVAFNLLVDYRAPRTWTAVKLGFKNLMAIQDGTHDKLNLSKAFLGGRIVNGDTFTMDAELGRRPMVSVFDSKVQFLSTFDGALFRFSKAFESIGDFYTIVGSYLIDRKKDHYGYIAEMGGLNIANTGLLMKASYINWKKHYHNENDERLRFNFSTLQFTLGYLFTPESWPKLIKFYAAGLYNFAADNMADVFGNTVPEPFRNEKYNWAWYTGISIGEARKKGDWAIDTNFQWVEAQSVPDFDASGIGRGNADGVGFYTNKLDGGGGPTTFTTAVGNANYYGWLFDFLYACTDNITFHQRFEISDTLNSVGPDLTFRQLKIEFIYAF